MGKLKNIWEKIKKWAKETALPWLKKAWVQIINILVMFFMYGQWDNIVAGEPAHTKFALIVSVVWIFVLVGYWALKLLGIDKISLKRKK